MKHKEPTEREILETCPICNKRMKEEKHNGLNMVIYRCIEGHFYRQRNRLTGGIL